MSSHDFTPPRGDTSLPLATPKRDRKRVRSSGSRSPSSLLSMFLFWVDVVVVLMAFAGLHGPLRLILGLVLGLLIPGWSIVGPLGLGNGALAFGLTVAVSFALLMVCAQLLMAFHAWHLVALEEVTGLACLPSLLRQSKDRQRTRDGT